MNFKLYFTATLFLFALTIYGQKSGESDEAALAKATQNPLAAMYSLPFQNNTTYGYGPYDRTQNILNIQPVLPFSLGEKVNLINRIILPIVTQPSSTEDLSTTGTGDISWSAWLSPSKSGKIIWGIGPVLQLPTSSTREFGSGEFGIGPSFVALTTINQLQFTKSLVSCFSSHSDGQLEERSRPTLGYSFWRRTREGI